MRILLLAGGGDIGGGKTHILSLAKALSENNSVRLLSFREGIFADDAKAMGIDTVVIDHHLGIKHAIDTAEAQALEFAPQLIHCHGSKANMIGTVLKRKTHVPVMTTVHSDPKLDYMGKPFRKYTFGVINAIALKRMDHYIAVAGEMKKLLISRGFDPYRISTIFNGVDFSEADEYPKAPKAPGDTINVGIAARLNPVKDIETVIRAFALAYERNKRLRLLIAGTGEEEKKLRQLCNTLGIEEFVSFEGWQSDVKAFFRRVDINVLSSLSETFPYSLLEGALVHCPAIASNAGGIPYLIKHEKTGLLFECKDVRTFSEYIVRLADDEGLRRTLADNLFEYARDNYSLSAMADQQQNIYETVLRRSKKEGRRGAVICGAYGRGNAGDEAILKAIIHDLRSIDPDLPLWVMSKDPKQTAQFNQERSIYIFNPFSFLKALGKTELFISGGGSLIQDVTSSRSLYYYLATIFAAKKRRCKVMMYGCGVGPILKKSHEELAAKVINKYVDRVSLRDSMSKELFDSIGVSVPKTVIASDPTFGLPHADSTDIDNAFVSEGIPLGISMICFCLREWSGFTDYKAVADAAVYSYEKYGMNPVFMSIETPKDVAVAEKVCALIPESVPKYVCRKFHPDSEFIGMLSRMETVCGMRLHSLIFATAAASPAVALSYDVKVDGFFRDLNNDLIIGIDRISSDKLKEMIDQSVERGKTLSNEICGKFKSAEKKNIDMVRELIKLEEICQNKKE